MQRKKRRGWLGTILLAAILATAAFAYTTNVGFPDPTPGVGSGVQALANYQVTGIQWADDGADQVTGVSFDIAPAASVVRVNVDGSTWSGNCTMGSGNTHAVCSVGPIAASAVTQLGVFASS
jgi:hypothetical protein